jgi:hypothetical protein
MRKMNPELRQKWTSALRSGNYLQATGLLVDSHRTKETGKLTMCCLGVLEHVCGTPVEEMEKLSEDMHMPCYLAERKSPADVMRQKHSDLNLHTSNGEIYRAEFEEYLAHMNDNGKTFEEIADYIEKHI